jgi:uncharacterized repeat protein (TIGR03803 family)
MMIVGGLRSKPMQLKSRTFVAALVALAIVGAARGAANGVAVSGAAVQEQVLYTFQGAPNDGDESTATLIADSTGTLYGTTSSGGNSGCNGAGCGTVFKLTPVGSGYTESVLYNFKGPIYDGANPTAALVADANGALYGTTSLGGSTACATGQGCGTVFKLTPSGSGYSESVLYYFQNSNDGSNPQSSLLLDGSGALYGTANFGGAFGYGTVFKLTPTKSGYTESTLYAFKEGTKYGAYPSGLTANKDGALFGETGVGGSHCPSPGCGIVFKLTPTKSGYSESVLWNFKNTTDGSFPSGGLLIDANGGLIGTAVYRGCCGPEAGTVFELIPSGSNYKERTLHIFVGRQDGKYPGSGVVADSTGALYGTTAGGGSSRHGTVFKLTPSGSKYTETILYDVGGSTGARPNGILIDSAALYGTTYRGPNGSGYGTVFKVTQ